MNRSEISPRPQFLRTSFDGFSLSRDWLSYFIMLRFIRQKNCFHGTWKPEIVQASIRYHSIKIFNIAFSYFSVVKNVSFRLFICLLVFRISLHLNKFPVARWLRGRDHASFSRSFIRGSRAIRLSPRFFSRLFLCSRWLSSQRRDKFLGEKPSCHETWKDENRFARWLSSRHKREVLLLVL